MHSMKWHEKQIDPTGWYISEKLDGMRAFWDGKHLFSKQGAIYFLKREYMCLYRKHD